MKKIFLTLAFSISVVSIAQEITTNDALRYAIDNMNGTARFRSMGGAFGAVGGDLSAININPAGSLFFNNNFASVSVSNFNNCNESNYFGKMNKESYSTLDLNQIGAVFVFDENSGKSGWNKISFAVNYENTKNLDNRLFVSGYNPYNSISQYFVDQANFVTNTPFNDYQYEMAYETYIINPSTADPNVFVSNVSPGGNYYQDFFTTANGYNGKLTANIATSYKNKLFLGLNLNAHFTDFVTTSRLYEYNDNPENPSSQPTVREIVFDNQLSSYGSGFSFNLGAIYKVDESLRLGVAYESPTWLRLKEELVQDLYTYGNVNVPAGDQNRYYEGPIFIFPAYKLKTPGRVTASATYIFGKKGLISIDVASKDYSKTEYKNSYQNNFRDINSQLSNELTTAYEVRIGGEYKIKQWSIRGGYRFEESPYKYNAVIGDLTSYSTGIGYNFGESRLDLSYANTRRDYNQNLISSGMTDTARIKNIQDNITLTYAINF
ncbi:outer membrane protein transport protein [Flavobacterium sp. HXWNR69]|uniref:Outer membrane protein transport protein n=1 Tax=Flavobacterium fragile TaxID=2949085 RepID=A0ABT0TFS2_9FLAO|nr:outer membrane protein transport protein [Flavobacterium sp. HXWNR69]MCL9769829.1 outer membrane protein transport protein [Flavobacterium sp. HXWNR69]